MALYTFTCNHLMPLHFEGLKFSSVLAKKSFQLLGDFVPRALPGLQPWVPLEDFRPPETPTKCPPDFKMTMHRLQCKHSVGRRTEGKSERLRHNATCSFDRQRNFYYNPGHRWHHSLHGTGVLDQRPCLGQDRRIQLRRGQLTLSPPTPLRLYSLPYWSNPPFLPHEHMRGRSWES